MRIRSEMATYEEHQEAVTAAAAGLAEVERQKPSTLQPVLSGDCKQDVRNGNEWLDQANERAAIRATWQDKRDLRVASHRKARAAALRWWRAMVEEAIAEDERRFGPRDDDAAA
jgi:hypothetical protein